ncbi:MAG: hypothetical protein P9X24_11565, partial [Candidatus Hatepunaea meridiana]|nr:hypothetical protein [Candidatus Hatepunaea meridiana]
LKLDAQGVDYRMKDNSFTWAEDIDAINRIAFSLTGRQIQERINYWMGRLFKFDKGKYSTCPRPIHHDWYRLLDSGLDLITKELYIKRAA